MILNYPLGLVSPTVIAASKLFQKKHKKLQLATSLVFASLMRNNEIVNK
jgi:hypothetical protein